MGINFLTKTTSTPYGGDTKSKVNLKEGRTLYSFRNSSAIELFKRTGSLQKLQQAMGHSSLKVSLIYLRGLEINELNEEDMRMVLIDYSTIIKPTIFLCFKH